MKLDKPNCQRRLGVWQVFRRGVSLSKKYQYFLKTLANTCVVCYHSGDNCTRVQEVELHALKKAFAIA